MAPGKEERKIKPIDKAAVHRICSGQVILDLATAVKEVVENSLDAGATSIDIRLKDHGAELIEVADNGTGVSPDNYQGLTLKYHTSKISNFGDLQTLASFGFRGEALSSLCALGKVSIVTRTRDEPVAVRLEYDHTGLLVKKENVARAVGTTVSIAKLFSPLPVRYKEFRRENNIRREYGRLLSVLQAYALIARGVRLICSNQNGKSGRNVVVQTQGNSSMRDNVVTVFGTKTAACLEWLDLKVLDGLSVEGFVSKPGMGSGRPSGDRQFFYVNGRPVDMPKVAKLVNELYRSFNSHQYPMLMLNFILPTTAYDVNVTPDKRKLFLHSEGELLTALRESLENVYTPTKYTYVLNNIQAGSVSTVHGSSLSNKPVAEAIRRGSNIPADASGDENEDQEVGDALGDTGAPSSEGAVSNVQASGKASLNSLLSFQHTRARGVSANDGPGLKQRAFGPVSTTSRSTLLTSEQKPARQVQGTLTACVLRTKRATVQAESDLLSEEPVLKRWRKSNAVTSEGGSESEEDACPEVDGEAAKFEREDGSFGTFDAKGRHQENGRTMMGSTDPDDEDDESPCGVKSRKDSPFATGMTNGTMHRAGEDGLDMERPSVSPSGSDDETGCLDSKCRAEDCHEFPSSGLQENDPEKSPGRIHSEGRSVEKSKFPLTPPSSDRMTIVDNPKGVPLSDMSTNGKDNKPVIHFSIDRLRRKSNLGLLKGQTPVYATQKKASTRRSRFTAATLNGVESENVAKDAVLDAATKELERSFNKADFKKMKVVGQFNLGFILAKIHDDVFIVDQHASDEKCNFERLTRTTILNRQPLLRPVLLELSAAEEMTVMSHIQTFRYNGFDFTEDKMALPCQRLRLSAVPFSQNVTFDVGDVQDLISALADEPVPSRDLQSTRATSSDQVDDRNLQQKAPIYVKRPRRVKAMLASRACRSSVMIGDPLSKKEMERILSNLATLDSPWNCPHGRPTMRHLVDLSAIAH